MGYSDDGCELASTVCKCDLFVLSWAMRLRVRRMCPFGAANVWLRCAQYFVISSCS